jgi:HKD family nuclease
MKIINQPWDGAGQRLGDHLNRLLREMPRFDHVFMLIAFVKRSGLSRLAEALREFMDAGGCVGAVVGIDQQGTSIEGLCLLLKCSNEAYIFHNRAFSSTFHPKVYLFERSDERAVAIVGSGNLTAGGLYTNYETSLLLELDLNQAQDLEVYESLRSIYEQATDLSGGMARLLDEELIGELVRRGMVISERRALSARRPAAETVEGVEEPVDTEVPESLFRRSPVLPPPTVAPGPSVVLEEEIPSQVVAVPSGVADAFVMTLGSRDVRQRPGYSRDIYLPLAARDAMPSFWGWPDQFQPGSGETVGTYAERFLRIHVYNVRGERHDESHVRLYYYAEKSEFRLNCTALVRGANVSDILLIRTLTDDPDWDYEANVISVSDPGYPSLLTACSTLVKPPSTKRWGYL